MPKIAFLTAGGLAPCLSSSIGALIEQYAKICPDAELVGYLNGYQGLLLGKSIAFPKDVMEKAHLLHNFGGSPIGNSRVKLTNIKDCVERGLVKEGQDPLHMAAEQLTKDKIDILHTIGGDDTNTAAASLAAYLGGNTYPLTVVGMPKTVDNDVFPIVQTLGAWTAAEQGALFYANVANENTTSMRQLIIHEVMGRSCGWLAAATAQSYRERIAGYDYFYPEMLLSQNRWDIDAVWLPEMNVDLDSEIDRLNERMATKDCVHLFLSEGAGIDAIIKEMEASGEEVPRDAFGHPRIDKLNPGQWFAKQLAGKLGAEKVLVQKSGYFARSAAPNAADIDLIRKSAAVAAQAAMEKTSGVAGLDEDQGGVMRVIEFPRIKGHKSFDIDLPWFGEMLEGIGQPKGSKVAAH
jgi:pyrophosphate--fructose-6-phosphate 1-phosphotransferase